MAKKIATVSTVFAACDRLDAANDRWNREDVRAEVGGGGYIVIDPLIKAWRELKPLREAAPTTPAELLHQVAASLEAHITGFIGETESLQSESQQVFDATVSELSEKLTSQETALREKEASLQVMAEDHVNLMAQLEDTQQSLNDAKTDNARLLAENDGLRGQIARMESDHKATTDRLNAESKEQAQEYALERARATKEHSAAMTSQRKALVESAEQAENRLMMLLDQERQASKESAAQLRGQLKEMSDKAQSSRENEIELEATIRNLSDENAKLMLGLGAETARGSELSKALNDEQKQVASIQREFQAYKKEHKLSGDLGAVQAAVSALQEKLEERHDE